MKQPTMVNMALGVRLYKTLPEYRAPKEKWQRLRENMRKNSKLDWLNKILEAVKI